MFLIISILYAVPCRAMPCYALVSPQPVLLQYMLAFDSDDDGPFPSSFHLAPPWTAEKGPIHGLIGGS